MGLPTVPPLFRAHRRNPDGPTARPPAEVARTLLLVMRRGSWSAAEAIPGHKAQTIRRWLPRAAHHAECLTEVLVKDLPLTTVEVDAFWSFVKKSTERLTQGRACRAGWARVGAVFVGMGVWFGLRCVRCWERRWRVRILCMGSG